MRTYTKDFVVKGWDELTAEQRKEVIARAYLDDIVMDVYYGDEREIFDNYIDLLKDVYKNVYDDIDLEWAISSQGPYVAGKGWTVHLHKRPVATIDLSDVGIDAEVKVTIYNVYPDAYNYVLPDFDHFDVSLVYPRIPEFEDLIDVDIEALIEKSARGEAFLNTYANIYSEPLKKYWETCEDYARGFQDIDRWLKRELSDGTLRAVYSVDKDGNEVFEKFLWE